MNSPDRASGGSASPAPQDLPGPDAVAKANGVGEGRHNRTDTAGTLSTAPSSTRGRTASSGSSERGPSPRGPSPRSSAVDPDLRSNGDRTRMAPGGGGGGAAGDAEAAAGSSSGGGGGGGGGGVPSARQPSQRQGGAGGGGGGRPSRRSHRRSASDGDPSAAAAALDERRRQRLLKTRHFQSREGAGSQRRRSDGGREPTAAATNGGGAPPQAATAAASAPAPAMPRATSADAAAVGFDPAVAAAAGGGGLSSSGRSKGGKHHRHRHGRHSRQHRRTNTMPELPTHEEGVVSPAAHPAVIAQAQAQAQAHQQAQMMAAQQAQAQAQGMGYGQYAAMQASAPNFQYYPQPQQLFPSHSHHSPNSPQSQAQVAQGMGPGIPALQGADAAPITPRREKRSSRKKERRRREKQMSDPSGMLFRQPHAARGGAGAGGGGMGPPLPPMSPAPAPSAFPPAPPLNSPGPGGGGGAPPRPPAGIGVRGRSSSYSVGDAGQQQQQHQQHQQTGGPIQPQLSERFSARTEFLALSKPLSASKRRLMEEAGGGVDDREAPLSPTGGGRPSLSDVGRAQSWTSSPKRAPHGMAGVPTSPGGQHQVIGAMPPPSPRNPPSGSRRANSFDVGGARGLSPLTEHMTLSMRDLQMPYVPVVPKLQDSGPPAGEGAPLLGGGGANGDHVIYTAPDGGDGGGNGAGAAEPFLSESFGRSSPRKSSHRRHGSTRKMHMRQQSVQLFMEDVRGSVQPNRCRDAFFAALFYVQLAAMAAIGVIYGPEAIRSNAAADGDGDGGALSGKELHVTYRNVFLVACMCGAFAAALSALALVVMTLIARRLVQVALVFSIGMAFAWGTIGIGLSPKSFVPVTGIIALALTVGYTFVVWDRIPFAAANLRTALSGIRSNLGTVAVAFLFQALALAWSVYYTFAVIGLYDAVENGDVNVGGDAVKVLVYVALGVAYYWTFQVIVHTVQATVAGVVGEWWYLPEEGDARFCSPALSGSFLRSAVLSFGSVCLGSLFVGPVQILRQVAENFRPNRDANVLMCLHECLVCFQECTVGCVDRMAEVFHPWAFTYVGMYGYGFGDAGRRATELFRKRGWTTIVTDDLIPNVLFIVSLVIGGVTGCFGLLVEALDGFGFTNLDRPEVTAFLIGLAVGIVLSSVLFSIISASVNAIIVCFAGSPVEFQQNHPDLSNDMRSAWREVWPGCMDIVDLKIGMGLGSGEMPGGVSLV